MTKFGEKLGDHFIEAVAKECKMPMSGASQPIEAQMLKENEVTQHTEVESDMRDGQGTHSAGPKAGGRRTKEDLKNIVLVYLLYALQGVPFGLLMSLPLILSSRGVSYADQGTLSFASWPYAIKILWAPFVDSFYIERIGRRKSWIVTIQLLLSFVSFTSGDYLSKILSTDWTRTSQDIFMLTIVFVVIGFLNATHDVVMDGWAIDLFLKENVSWQATCNSVGHITGAFVGNALFILLESEKFCNQYLRPLFGLPIQQTGFIDIKVYLYVYGSMLVACAVFILLFKSETNPRKQTEEKSERHSVAATYKLIWTLLCKREVQTLIFVYLTVRIGFSTEAVIRLRLIEEGVEKEKITILSIMLSPVMVALPVLLNKYLHGPRPLNLMLSTYGPKLLLVSSFTFFVVLTPYIKRDDSSLPLYYYAIYFLLNVISAACSFIFYVSIGSFNSQISDKAIGGTYMTFLSLWVSTGRAVLHTLVLYLTNIFTFKYCFVDPIANGLGASSGASNMTASTTATVFLRMTSLKNGSTRHLTSLTEKCYSEMSYKACEIGGGTCLKYFDGFYLLTFVFVGVGFIWLIFTKKTIARLQSIPKSTWIITK